MNDTGIIDDEDIQEEEFLKSIDSAIKFIEKREELHKILCGVESNLKSIKDGKIALKKLLILQTKAKDFKFEEEESGMRHFD